MVRLPGGGRDRDSRLRGYRPQEDRAHPPGAPGDRAGGSAACRQPAFAGNRGREGRARAHPHRPPRAWLSGAPRFRLRRLTVIAGVQNTCAYRSPRRLHIPTRVRPLHPWYRCQRRRDAGRPRPPGAGSRGTF